MQFAMFWGRCPKCSCTVFWPGPWAGLPFKTWNGLKTRRGCVGRGPACGGARALAREGPGLRSKTLNGLKRLAEGRGDSMRE